MRELDVILPKVITRAPNCPEPLAIEHLRDAAIKFCERTRLWREVADIDVLVDDLQFECTPPYCNLHEIAQVTFDGLEIYPAKFDLELNRDEYSGPPQWYSQIDMNNLRLSPRATGTVRLVMYLKPAQNGELIPDYIADQYSLDIAHGALGSLLLLPNQPFTSPQLGTYYGGLFNKRLDELFAKHLKGQQRARLRTTPQYF